MTPMQKLVKARAGLILDQPFFGSIAIRLGLLEDPSCETMWVDGVQMGFNPGFVEKLTLEQTKGVVAHEVMHVACSHNTRRQDREHEKWNIAGDGAINDVLIDSGFVLPGSPVKGFGPTESAESIYNKLPDPPKGSGKGSGAGKGSGKGSGKSPGKGPKKGSGKGAGKDSGVGKDPGGCGEVRDHPNGGKPMSAADKEKIGAATKVMVAQAAQAAKTRGTVPAGLKRLIDDILESKVDWRAVLQRFLMHNAKDDYSWSRPNRMHLHRKLYLPSMHSNALGDVTIMVDTSGSLSERLLTELAAEINGIKDVYDCVMTVIYCDSQVSGVQEFQQGEDLVLEPKGGGGTDFRPPFAWLDENGKSPTAVVYLTDGYCSKFPEFSASPVLWVLPHELDSFKPPFGEVIVAN